MSGDQLGEYATTGFRKFDHVERGKHRGVDGIARGTCHVFPKLDGTNGHVWAEEAGVDAGIGYVVKCGSRNNVLSETKDNAGFHAYINGDSDVAENLRLFVLAHPDLILYGEWLVPHTIKGYQDDAWRKFYVFDVFSRTAEAYVSYDIYYDQLVEAGIDVLPAVVMTNPAGPELDELAAVNAYLCKPGEFGEGIVLKNYGWRNLFDRQPWMKVLRDGFMDKKAKPAKGADYGAQESEIAEALVDGHLVEKEFAKGVVRLAESMKVHLDINTDGFVEEHRGKVIGILLAQVFNDVIDDGLTARALKKFGFPTVDFRVLRAAVTRRVKELKPELFS